MIAIHRDSLHWGTQVGCLNIAAYNMITRTHDNDLVINM